MKILLSFALTLTAFASGAADINITNVTHAASVPPGSYVLGTTGSVTRLIPTALIGGGSQIWTNDGTYTWLSGSPPPDISGSTPGPQFFFRNSDGSFFCGTNLFQIQSLAAGLVYPMYVDYLADAGEPTNLVFLVELTDSALDNYDCTWSINEQLRPDLPLTEMTMVSVATNTSSTLDFVAKIATGPMINAFWRQTNIFKVNAGPNYVGATAFRTIGNTAPADVGGMTYSLSVVTNGTDTATMHFTNGVLMSITAP